MPVVSKVSTGLRWLITLLVCIAVFAALAAFKFLAVKAVLAGVAAQPEHSESVEATMPVPVDFKPTLRSMGVAVAPQQLTLRNELAGYIAQLQAPSGSAVKKGQVILQLDISEQQANLASAQARLKLAQLEHERDLNLQKAKYVSQQKADTSAAQVDVVKAEIAGINSVINRRTIRAPFDGVLGIHQHEVGQYLAPNSEIVALVGNSNQMWVDFSVPQFYGELEPGQSVQVQVIRAGTQVNTPPLAAVVIAGNASINSAARSRLYRAVVSEHANELMNNMSVAVELSLGTITPLLSIPATAIRSDTGGQYVFVLEKAANAYRAKRLSVTTYSQQGEQVYVDAVKTTDLIATAGAFKLYPGVLVNVTTRSSGSAPSGGAQ